MPERLCIFVDGSNFYNSLKDLGKPVNISFRKLALELTGAKPDRQLVQLYYYNSPLPTPYRTDPDYARKDTERRRQQSFFNALRVTPNLTSRFGYLRRLPNGDYVEKRVDVMLATDLVVLALKNIYDVAIVDGCGSFGTTSQVLPGSAAILAAPEPAGSRRSQGRRSKRAAPNYILS